MSSRWLCSLALLTATTIAVRAADPAAELASFSVFPSVDLNALAGGEIRTQRSPGGSGRTLAAQSVFVMPGSPTQAAEALRRFNPQRHGELKVYLHADLSGAPSAGSFSALKSAPNNGAVQTWVKNTAARAATLQLTAADAAQTPTDASVAAVGAFWAEVLAKRASEFASGGIGRVAPYENGGANVKPGVELSALIRGQEKLQKQFGGLLASTVENAGGKPSLSWELGDTEDEAVASLGAFYVRPQANGAVQAVDCGFYSGGGYYVAVTLYQLWPVEIGGKPMTLAFRADLVSSAQLGSLRGVERLGAESLMLKKIKRATTLVRGK